MTQPTSKAREQTPLEALLSHTGVTFEGNLTIRPPESRDERKHRHWKERRSFWVKEASSYLIALLILTVTAVYCFWVLFWHPNLPKEDRQWVMSIVTSLVVGIIGYLFGKVTK